MTSKTPTTPNPGWYTAPGEAGLERYWTGTAWADERRPVAPAAAPASGRGIAGLVLSIIALVVSITGAGLLIGLVALFVARPAHGGVARAARILATIAVVVSLLWVIRGAFAAVGS